MPQGFHPRRQGDLGEAAAIQWLTSVGAAVSFPLFHSPDYDLIADFGRRVLRVQVKTSSYTDTSNGHYAVQLATSGGNQSWTGVVKEFDRSRCDSVFVLVADGRCWFIPSREVEGRRSLQVGGMKYSEFEVQANRLTLTEARGSVLESAPEPGEYPSGQRGCTVNAMALPSQVRILPPPSDTADPPEPPAVGRTRMSANHQVTVPLAVAAACSIGPGDRFRVESDGRGRFVMTRIEEYMELHIEQLALPDAEARDPAERESSARGLYRRAEAG
jgi:bifunctional DNA-binding transcriptional regulator/antitoxin component of YhaV-PrlF toxin-antitoxin module